jgi:hypothetical protein
MRNLATAALLVFTAAMAAAHEGHGFSGAHWHASDLFGPLVLVAIGAALWWARRK